jgi:hypothetical protein
MRRQGNCGSTKEEKVSQVEIKHKSSTHLWFNQKNIVPFNNLKTASPTLRADADVVYLVSMLGENDQTTWIVTIDTRTKSPGEVVPFSAQQN